MMNSIQCREETGIYDDEKEESLLMIDETWTGFWKALDRSTATRAGRSIQSMIHRMITLNAKIIKKL